MKERVNERWVDIKGYEGLYQVSDAGNVRKIGRWHRGLQDYVPCTPKPIARTGNGHGYLLVCLSKHGRKNHYVHRLVADAFIPKVDGRNCVNHLDYNKSNNNVSNLEWCTYSENMFHSSYVMRRRRNIKTNTGERYITYRECKNEYRVIISLKEYGTKKTLEEAVKLRDSILEGMNG